MLTNTYLPHVGGVARSVERFRRNLESMDCEVRVVAPEFPDTPAQEECVIRVPAVQNFNGSDFSVRLPVPGLLTAELDEFQPQLVHSHHPFLLGDTALRIASARKLPLVFTHHTMYERYTHYVPGDSPATQRFAVAMATEYANLCDHVVAPSESIAGMLRERGVAVPIEAIPTGVDVEQFAAADRSAGRRRHELPEEALVVGHVGRLAHEKNLVFLAKALTAFLKRRSDARALIVGDGDAADDVREVFEQQDVADRLRMPGSLDGQELIDAYGAMDIFAFASTSETQGMVLAEAMAAGVPVVALDAPGARELVDTDRNGVLVNDEDQAAFTGALEQLADLDDEQQQERQRGARETAESVSERRCAERLLNVYRQMLTQRGPTPPGKRSTWEAATDMLEKNWELWKSRLSAASQVVTKGLRSDEK
jgi:glycosyltransferase involved in cell wall biosynthesis